MSEYSTNHGYDAARNLRGTQLELSGATYQNRDWIKAQNGVWDKKAKVWSLPQPTNNKAAAELLYQIVKRGMQWRAK